jgi:hypothetical protein
MMAALCQARLRRQWLSQFAATTALARKGIFIGKSGRQRPTSLSVIASESPQLIALFRSKNLIIKIVFRGLFPYPL